MNPQDADTHNVIEFILALFAEQGANEYMGEAVTMSQHMEQSAACATSDGASDSLVAATLLHDIGHFIGAHPIDALENGIDNNHETVGANYLQAHFPDSVSEPVRLHVAAKRYLCATDPAYLGRLSAASVNSLKVQGGPMNASEVRAFEANPYHRDAVQLRLYDDDGKVAGLTIKPVTAYRATLESLVIQKNMNSIRSFKFTREQLSITWADGAESELLALWLRDHCQMPVSRHPANGQRLLNITDIPADIGIANVARAERSLIVEFTGAGHRSEFDVDWLRANCYCLNAQPDDRSEAVKTLWQGESFAQGLPRCNYTDFCDRASARLTALQAVRDLGLVILEGVDCTAGEVLNVINQFGFVRETNYGSLFDVRTTVDPTNLAFTNLGLGCHLDNPYRDPVPGLQLLHCLESSTSGGESILQDGFMAASVLRRENPAHFKTLSRNWINFRFRDAATDLQARVPFIEVNDLEQVIKVRFNNRSIDTLKLPPATLRQFYPAYRHYAEILERASLQITFKLRAGELMLFDNTRILHARTAFSAAGTRHLQGAYSDLDGLYSSLRQLEARA